MRDAILKAPLAKSSRQAALLALLLVAACGGGGGGAPDTAVGSTPAPGASADNTNNNAPATPAPNGNASGAVAGSNNTAAADIDADGISVALLATLLDQFSARGTAAASQPVFATARASRTAAQPSANASQPAQVGLNQTAQASTYLDGSTDAATYSPAVGRWNHILRNGAYLGPGRNLMPHARFPQLTIGMLMEQGKDKGKDVLTLRRDIGVQQLNLDANGQLLWIVRGNLQAPLPVVLPFDQRLPFGKPLMTWGTPSTPGAPTLGNVDFIVQRGDQPREARICWQIRLDTLFRDICTYWQVPQDWSYGKPVVAAGYAITDWLGNNQSRFNLVDSQSQRNWFASAGSAGTNP
ncbi:MAG: hypothetical protein Q4D19_04050 [Lautropia sp.]|nr:hypothetical protein [Lautropia sp.]